MQTTKFIWVSGLLAALPSCFNGSGRLESRSFQVSDFDSIEVDRNVEVDITHADRFDVSVVADDNLWGNLQVDRQDRTLRVHLSDGVPIYQDVTVRATVAMPALAAIHASGGGKVRLSGFNAPALDAHASGGSRIEGDSNIDAVALHLSGGSRADLQNLRSGSASVELSGGSGATLTVDRSLDVDLSGGSHLVYFGNPRLGKNDTSGGSTMERR
jgi:hypothetical protein